MSETATVTNIGDKKRISISFTRKLSDGNYGGFEATAWIEGEIDKDATAEATAHAAGGLFLAAKAAVLDELGIKWEVDEQGVIRETETPFVSAPQAAQAIARTMGGTPAADPQQDTGGIRIMNAGAPGVSTDPIPANVIAKIKKDGITAVWDQRHTATGGQPQFKEAVPRGGTGHGKDGQAKGYWVN